VKWKRELQVLADELGIAITVNHLPPGTSKWNRIEHKPETPVADQRHGYEGSCLDGTHVSRSFNGSNAMSL
jgi:hypothetical protein